MHVAVCAVPVAGRVLEPAPQGGAVPVPGLPPPGPGRRHHHRRGPEGGLLPHQAQQGQPLSQGKSLHFAHKYMALVVLGYFCLTFLDFAAVVLKKFCIKKGGMLQK